MMRARAWLLLGAVLHAMPAAAQDPGAVSSDSVAQFLDAARRAAEKYRERAVAVREGFRRVGPDFPGMGEHWIQPGRLVSARFRVEAPAVLTYAVIGGEPSLTRAAALRARVAAGVPGPGQLARPCGERGRGIAAHRTARARTRARCSG
ncbi:MAG TPA: hypothetical protein VK939_03715 [Longimicrobiales bacterium]|nr:hypothetical protein [Longimicrobiales bacterium]